jgi:hypothetical protein
MKHCLNYSQLLPAPQAKLVQLQQAGTNGYKRKLLTLFLTILGPGAREKTLLTTKDLRLQRRQPV